MVPYLIVHDCSPPPPCGTKSTPSYLLVSSSIPSMCVVYEQMHRLNEMDTNKETTKLGLLLCTPQNAIAL